MASSRNRLLLAPFLPRVAVQWADEDPASLWRVVEGSLAFVDISGFTALSERLARRGRVGAEELTELLNACFEQMLAVAYGAGGSLLKFGGDALLLLFDGEGHAARACASADEMGETLRQAGRMSTSAGTVRLRMSVGVHSGEIHLFRVGASHRELIVTGPGATSTVEMESVAQAGEVMISGGTAAQLDPRAVGEARGGGWLLRRRRAKTTTPSSFPPAPAARSDLRIGIPVSLRDHLLAGTVEAEHRTAVVGFVHFDGIDGLIATHGPAEAAEALDRLVAGAQAAAEDEGVTFLATDIDRDGGKIILVGGAPRALGDDEGRMLRAVRRLVSTATPLPLRIGVHHGPVFAGPVGPPYRRTYTVMGDTVNLAARLMANAPQGSVLATGAVLDASHTNFDAKALPPFMVKGKAAPVEAFQVGEPIGRQTGRAASSLPFRGRDAELSTLLASLDRARQGSGGLIDIVGPSGIGKSRLVEELRFRAGDTKVVRAFCEPFQARTPYFAFRYLVRGALGLGSGGPAGVRRLRAIVNQQAPQLRSWLPLLGDVTDLAVAPTDEVSSLEPHFRRRRTAAAVVDLLRVAAPRPCVFVVEDAQWLDDASGELLEAVASVASEYAWLFVVARHDDAAGTYRGASAPVTHRLSLAPLDHGATHDLLSAATDGAPLLPHERQAIVHQAGGNPLFLEEIINARRGGRTAAELPSSLEAVITTEIDRLAPGDRRLLRYAAVLGVTFRPSLVSEVAGGEVTNAANRVVRRLGRFVEPAGDDLFRFRNHCFWKAAYETLPFARRRELHARAGEAIERAAGPAGADAQAEVLSLHFFHAQQHERCWRYAMHGARHAGEKFANVDAVELYQRALAVSPNLATLSSAEVAEAWEALGDVSRLAGLIREASSAFTRARRLHDNDPAATARLFLKQARLADAAGAVRWIRRGLRIVESSEAAEEVKERAELRVELAKNRLHAGRHRQAIRLCEAALDESARAGGRRAMGFAYLILDWAYMDLGKPALATNSARALAIYEELGDLSSQAIALNNLGGFAIWLGRWEEALSYLSRSRSLLLRVGDLENAAWSLCNVVELLIDQGRLEEAESSLAEAVGLFRSLRSQAGEAEGRNHLGRLALRRDQLVEARAHLEASRQAFEAEGRTTKVLEIDSWLGECLLRSGELDAALAVAEDGLRRSAHSGDTTFLPALHRIRGYVRAAQHEVDDAWPEFDESLRVARARDAKYEIALALNAISTVAALVGLPGDPAAEGEQAGLVRDLGIRSLPPSPLPARVWPTARSATSAREMV